MPIVAPNVTATITSQNSFTDKIQAKEIMNFSVSGTFVATVTVQRSFDDGVTWHDLETYTAPYQDVMIQAAEEPMVVRAGVKTGAFTSGSIVVRISY
jgi:hypothetical protein